MKYVVSYKIRKNGKWCYKRHVEVEEDKLNNLMSDPNVVFLN